VRLPDGSTDASNVLVCEGDKCQGRAGPEMQHKNNWMTVLEYYDDNGLLGTVEHTYCSRGCLRNGIASPAAPAKPTPPPRPADVPGPPGKS
jgi:hypothetical protein